jgi:SAM-dependent methyltransferase
MNETPVIDRFSFGKNWRSFASIVDEESIAEAERGLLKLFPHQELSGARVLDIGCGSGLSIAAALRLGAAHIHGIDVDSDSVRAAVELLSRFDMPQRWSVETIDLFDLPVHSYDIVYAWGVLHHTGEMWRALDHASRCVRPGGLLAAAIYRRSPACPFWRWEKRVYNRAYAPVRTAIRSAYKAIYLAAIAASGRNPLGYVMDYHRSRGMSFHHDIHDWLGGYPYESAAPAEIIGFLAERGFLIERSFQRPAALKGLFGSHCDEYVVRRKG